MQRREPPRLNRAGRPVWFVFDDPHDAGGRPVSREGWRALGFAALWLVVCGTVFPIVMVATFDPRWLIAMFVVGGAGLAVFARLVIRHS